MDLNAISEAERQNQYAKLYAFTQYLLGGYTWFRRTADDSYVGGKTAPDYVVEAITQHLEHPEKYDPTKRRFVRYLKKHTIRCMIRDDAELGENTTTADRPSRKLKSTFKGLAKDQEPSGDWRELIAYADQLFDEKMDYQTIIQEVKSELVSDPEALTIFEGVC